MTPEATAALLREIFWDFASNADAWSFAVGREAAERRIAAWQELYLALVQTDLGMAMVQHVAELEQRCIDLEGVCDGLRAEIQEMTPGPVVKTWTPVKAWKPSKE